MEDNFIKSVKEVVERNLENEGFSIEQLCKEIGLSRTQVHRKIKTATQLSTSLFIRKLRLEKARELLEQADYNISEIAYLTGHKSPQNFSKYFFEEFGVSPTEYRKNRQAGKMPAQVSEQTISPLSKSTSKARLKSLAPIAGIIMGVILISGFVIQGIFYQSTSVEAAAPAQSVPSIAILPFQNFGPDSDDYFCEGVVEDILTYLAQFEGIKVISRTSTNKYKDTQKSIQQISEELQVAYLLEGSIRQDSQEVRITAQLIRTGDDGHVWARRYDRPKKNIMEIQAEVAKAIALSLNQSLKPKVQQKLNRIPTDNVEAYTAVLRGRHLMRNRTKEDLYASITQFEKALKLDSSYAEAYIGLASANFLLSSLRYAPQQEKEYIILAERNALKAIKFDSSSGEAYGILGNIYSQQYRWEEAISAFEIALNFSPNNAMLNYWFSLTLRSIGDLDRALKYHKIAGELDPLHPVIHAGYIYTISLAGDFDLAEQVIKEVEPVMSESFLLYMVWGNMLLRKGDYEAAIPVLDRSLELNPEFRHAESDKYFCLGKLDQKEKVLDYIATLDESKPIDCLRKAKAYISIGEKNKSLQFLQKAASLGLVHDDLIVNPNYTSLHNHPEFIEILKQYNFYSFLKAS